MLLKTFAQFLNPIVFFVLLCGKKPSCFVFHWVCLVVFRYLRSLVETILIYQHFKKPGSEPPAPKQELVDFWMDFLVESTKKDVSSVRFPVSNKFSSVPQKKNATALSSFIKNGIINFSLQVLILEPTKVYQPSYLSINKDVEDNTVSIWHVAPDDKVCIQLLYRSHKCNFFQ